MREGLQRGGVASFHWSKCPDVEQELAGLCDRHGVLPNFLRIYDGRLSESFGLIALSRKDPLVRAMTKRLASWGYFLYRGATKEAKLIHRDRIPSHWDAVLLGDVAWTDSGLGYRLELPKGEEGRYEKLLVVFSSIHPQYNSSSLWRYFAQSYRHMSGLTPGDTAILRIADVGGVVGAFYSDTKDRPHNGCSVERLIWEFADRGGVDRSKICLLGSSKGGTAAAMRGLSMNVPFVSVDPILSDAYYESSRNDAHFTGEPVFLRSKEDEFSMLKESVLASERAQSVFFTARGSRQCSEVKEYVEELGGSTLMIESLDSRITRHEEVAPGVLGATVGVVNALLMGFELPTGSVLV